MGKLYCNVDTILVEGRRFNRGDELVDVPAGSLDSMIRLRQATEVEPVEPDEPAAVDVDPVVVDWREARINESDLPNAIKKAMAAEGLSTAGEVIAFGEKHSTLTVIKGIAEAGEDVVKKWLTSIAPAGPIDGPGPLPDEKE